MLKFKKGDKVVQVVKPIAGEIVRAHIVDDSEVHYIVGFTGEGGEPSERSFTEDQIQADPTDTSTAA